MKILHTGDIHLDSAFSRPDSVGASSRRDELRKTFTRMMRYARENGIDMILIAGDLFEDSFISRETIAMMIREFSAFGKPIVISPGNHDCASPGSIWEKNVFPENVYVFTEPTLSYFAFDQYGADVYGYAFTSPSRTDCPLNGAEVNNPDRINLLCAHGDTSSPLSSYCPITKADIAAFGAEYAALGHIHNPESIVSDGSRAYGYCGCLEARGPDETGKKGAIVVDMQKKNGIAHVTAQRIRFSSRRYERLSLDCTGADTLAFIEDALVREIEKNALGADTCLRAVLTGAVSPSLIIDKRALGTRFSQLLSLEVLDETIPQLDAHEFENDRTVRGAFYRAMREKIENASPREREIAVRALRVGLAAIAGENISDF